MDNLASILVLKQERKNHGKHSNWTMMEDSPKPSNQFKNQEKGKKKNKNKWPNP